LLCNPINRDARKTYAEVGQTSREAELFTFLHVEKRRALDICGCLAFERSSQWIEVRLA
jgi:hypothetical protein